jgi:hypothetical protein
MFLANHKKNFLGFQKFIYLFLHKLFELINSHLVTN